METLSSRVNPLLKRTEVRVVFAGTSNPGVAKVTEDLAAQLKVAADTIVIKSLVSYFGKQAFHVEAFAYESAADKLRVEQKPKQKKEAAH